MTWFLDLSGKVFGRLTVMCKAPTRQWGSIVWVCKCICGNTIATNGASLRYGRTQSCGCLALEASKANRKEQAARNKVWQAYTGRAKHLGIVFSLSNKVFNNLIFGNCYYCGVEPYRESKSFAGDCVKYNGIDRLSFEKGYTKRNCVSCCKTCNWMKRCFSLREFLEHVKRIARHTHGKL